ncbi:MAG: 4-alpha-glucanotransferase [Clostridiaceae bacterium]|nr:4-alpha-glucanotransferase [Clostridiaceae bacterium]
MHFKVAAKDKTNHRYSGVLVHPTSFPSPYGIGDMGRGAHEFIDFLAMAGQHLWQVLPLGPSGNGNSPYQSYSVFAGQTLLISPELLIEKKLLTEADVHPIPEFNADRVDYDKVTTYKTSLFKKAYEHFRHTADKNLLEEYDSFQSNNQYWLDDYCLYMAGKDYHNGLPWYEWEDSLLDPTPKERASWMKLLASEIDYYRFIQFAFFSQWYELKDYANKKGIAIIGDIPIFTAPDSADVWANKELFKLDSKGHPLEVAGVPPDYFSATGQLWGNPLYDWDAMKDDGYRWWIERVRNQLDQVDYIRIDHFRGFEAYWAVPAGEETAMNGKWKKGPGEALFEAIQKALGEELPIFAEDLGIITPEVEKLRDTLGFPGMKILQFGFDGTGESTFLPHQLSTRNCICYTGTHDNDTTCGWYEHTSEQNKDKVRRYMNTDASSVSWDFIRTCLGTISKYAIFPVQDLLKLGSEHRMNTPGTATGNWEFRYRSGLLDEGMAKGLKQMTELFGRWG